MTDLSPELITALAVAVSFGVGIINLLYQRRIRFLEEQRQHTTLDERLSRLTGALNESAKTIKEIEAGLAERQKLANQLKQDVETYERLKQVRGPEVEAIARVLSGELEKEGRRSRWRDIALFVAGAIVSIVTTIIFG